MPKLQWGLLSLRLLLLRAQVETALSERRFHFHCIVVMLALSVDLCAVFARPTQPSIYSTFA